MNIEINRCVADKLVHILLLKLLSLFKVVMNEDVSTDWNVLHNTIKVLSKIFDWRVLR